MKNILIRSEQSEQYHQMEELVRNAFWDKYMPGCCEHLLVHKMRTSPDTIQDLCFAAEVEGQLAGGIWYSQALIKNDKQSFPVLTLGPVAVRPDLQNQGIGSALINKTLELAKNKGQSVLLYGNPAYYSRFGFRPTSDFNITTAGGDFSPALQIFPIGNVPEGAFDEGPIYNVAAEETRIFDKGFPHRQKHLNSSQLTFVHPTPPPEDPLLKMSWTLRQSASHLLKTSGIIEAWEKLGAKIRCVGSYRSNLMMKDKDIDLHIYTPILDVAQTLQALTPLLDSPQTLRLSYVNGADTDEKCLEWHLKIKDENSDVWTVDMIQILEKSKLDGFFEDTTEAIMDALTPDIQKTIVALKEAAPSHLKLCGIEYCKAVIEDHVRTWNQFEEWRKNNPPESFYKWRPSVL